MAELHVGAAFALRTLAQAAAVAKSGDTVIVHAGVYAAGFKPPAGTTWVAADAGAVVIDGGWKGGNLSPADSGGVGVLVSRAGVIMRGFEVRNVAGQGVAVSAGGDGFVLEDCEIHHTFHGAFVVNGMADTVDGVTVRSCHFHDMSLSGRWRETPVNGCVMLKSATNALVEDCLIERGYGEGLTAGSRSRGVVFRRVTVRDTRHLLVYAANRARDVLVEDVVVYQTGAAEWRQGDGDVGAGFVIGDEESGSKDDRWPFSENVTLRRCVAVNAGIALHVRNGTKTGSGGGMDGYNTRIQNLLIERCTFVGGPDARAGVVVVENDQGAAVAGVVRDCVMAFDVLAGEQLRNAARGIVLAGNVWTAGVPAGLPASNWAGRATALVAPFATIDGDLGLNLNNYRPRAGGPLDGAGVGALEPLPVEPPVDPPPPEPSPTPAGPDWDALRVLAVTAAQQLVSARANVTEAQKHTDGAAVLLNLSMLRLADARQAQTDAMTQVAALLAALNEAAKPAAK